MARGAVSKQLITKKLLSTFEGAFLYNDGKEIRVPIMEDGELIQVKVTLTAAKENVNPGDDNAIPGEVTTNATAYNEGIDFSQPVAKIEAKVVEPTDAEKQNVRDLLEALGL